jgi:uncharacterized protein YaaW (UPF0174 family)
MPHRLRENELRDWRHEDLGNLCKLLGINTSSSVEDIIKTFKWHYHSKTRAKTESLLVNFLRWALSRVSGRNYQTLSDEALRGVPFYDELIDRACKHVKASEQDATLAQRELHLSHAIVIAALQRMSPGERCKFFDSQIDAEEVFQQAGLKGASLSGPASTIAMLGVAQVSGFGIYMAASTALGFLTHAVGVTLPFALFSGMTSTIAFVIGPVGWLSVGLWGAWQLTEPEWKKLIPALIYIIAINSRMRLSGPS